MQVSNLGSIPVQVTTNNASLDKTVRGKFYAIHVQNLDSPEVEEAVLSRLSSVETVSDVSVDQRIGKVSFRAAEGKVGQAIAAAHSHLVAANKQEANTAIEHARAKIYESWMLGE